MAANYRMSVHRSKADLHLILMGDFDGDSAHALLDYLQRHCDGFTRVIIKTDGLRCIHPFERDVFRRNLALLADRAVQFQFSGLHAAKIAPKTDGVRQAAP